MKKTIPLLMISIFMLTSLVSAQSNKLIPKAKSNPAVKDTIVPASRPLITFVELGSVNCIPCKAMQPVMKAIEEKYGSQIKVVFYDVWKQEQAHYARQYGIKLIPTQVFLDANGKELMRHEGFFPEKEIDAFLQSKGLKAKTGEKG